MKTQKQLKKTMENKRVDEGRKAKARNSMSRLPAGEVGKAVCLLVFVVKRAGWQRQITFQYFFFLSKYQILSLSLTFSK